MDKNLAILLLISFDMSWQMMTCSHIPACAVRLHRSVHSESDSGICDGDARDQKPFEVNEAESD